MKALTKVICAAAASMLALGLAGCEGMPLTSGNAKYLKDINPEDFVTLGEYTGLSVNVEKPDADGSGEDSYVSSRLATLAGEAVTDRAAMMGDTANIDFAGKMSSTGEYFDGGTSQGYDLVLGSGSFIPGFEEGVVGMAVGESKDIPLTFPENYGSAALAGQDVIFEVKLNSLTGPTDSSVAALGLPEASTVSEYITYLRDQYAKQISEQYRTRFEEALREKIESGSVFKAPPEGMINRMKESYREQVDILANAYSNAYSTSITVSDLLSFAMSNEQFSGEEEDYVKKHAMESANTYMMIAAIAKEQGIEITDADVDAKMLEDLPNTDFSTIEEYKEKFDPEEVREQMLYDKVMDYLCENNSAN